MSISPEIFTHETVNSLALYPGQGQRPGDLTPFDGSEYRDLVLAYQAVTGIEFSDIKNIRSSETKSGGLLQPVFVLGSLLAVRQLELASESPFNPDIAIGHSLGEYSAMIQAGIWDPYAGFSIVQKRGEISDAISLKQNAQNGMMAVFYGENRDPAFAQRDLWEVLPEIFESEVNPDDPNIKLVSDVYMANQNGEEQVVISGPKESFEDIAETLSKYGIETKSLRYIDGAFHSPHMAEGVAALAECIEDQTTHQKQSSTVIYSPTLDRQIITAQDAVQCGSEILTRPVRLPRAYSRLFGNLALSNIEILLAIELGMSKTRSKLPQQGVQTKLLHDYLNGKIPQNVSGVPIITQTLRITYPDDLNTEAAAAFFGLEGLPLKTT